MYSTVQVEKCETAKSVRIRAEIARQRRREFFKLPSPVQPTSPPEIIAPSPEPEMMIQKLIREATHLAFFGANRTTPAIRDIQRMVCVAFDIPLVDLLSKRRSKDVCVPRHIAMILCRALTFHSLPEIGRRTGDRDHTTVLSAIRKYQWLIDQLHNELTEKNSLAEWVNLAHELSKNSRVE